ncbi:MAG: PilN domain-containing protein [Deltaproteobacteria bacterium]|nr:PilN domain-containing protein [Deltaproteobacteria bacterium]
MIKINLLPVRAAKKKETIRQQASIAGLSIVLLLIVLGILYFSISKTITGIQESVSGQEKEIARLDKEIGELKNVEGENKVILDKLNIVKQLEVNRRQHLKLFADIAGAIPEKLWIDSLKEAGQNITIMGFASGDEVVADFMRRLEKNLAPWKVELEIVNQVEKEKQKVAGFTIKLEKPKETAPPPAAKPKA